MRNCLIDDHCSCSTLELVFVRSSKLEARSSKLEVRSSKLEARSSKLEARSSMLEVQAMVQVMLATNRLDTRLLSVKLCASESKSRSGSIGQTNSAENQHEINDLHECFDFNLLPPRLSRLFARVAIRRCGPWCLLGASRGYSNDAR